MHGPVKPNALRDPAAPAPAAQARDAPAAAGKPPGTGEEHAHLRDALHMVLNVNVYDCAGRAVTVKDMLRGSLATQVRVALDRKRPG